VASSPLVEVVEADLPSIPEEVLRDRLVGCSAVISCLGHTLTLRGVLGPPRDLVTAAVTRLCRGVEALRPVVPVRLVLMSSVSVHRPAPLDPRRGTLARAFLSLLRAVLPPARDSQRAADLLHRSLGPDHPHLQWVVVRPDALREGEVSEYALHEQLVDGLLRPGETRMANVAHFMCDLVTDGDVWKRWRAKLPVIVDAPRRVG
jgi:hypothetical protein